MAEYSCNEHHSINWIHVYVRIKKKGKEIREKWWRIEGTWTELMLNLRVTYAYKNTGISNSHTNSRNYKSFQVDMNHSWKGNYSTDWRREKIFQKEECLCKRKFKDVQVNRFWRVCWIIAFNYTNNKYIEKIPKKYGSTPMGTSQLPDHSKRKKILIDTVHVEIFNRKLKTFSVVPKRVTLETSHCFPIYSFWAHL